MGSKTFDGVWFISFSDDHLPPHVHGKYAEAEVLIDLLPDGTVMKSERGDAVRPINAKRSQIRRILSVAAENAAEIHEIWEKMHGSPS